MSSIATRADDMYKYNESCKLANDTNDEQRLEIGYADINETNEF